jgi:hypothetical protein
MTPEDDAELSRCWGAWLVAREVGDEAWRRYAINQLRIAVLRGCESEGITVEWGGVSVLL